MDRVLCLDVGEKRIGVAVSDPLGITAQGVETIFTKGMKRDHARIAELAERYETKQLVIGLPRSMDGSVGFQAERVQAFAKGLAEQGFTIRWQDERLSTASARRTLLEADVSRSKRKQVIDTIAAQNILQTFLDAGGWRAESIKEEKNMDGNMERTNIVELFDENEKPVRFEHLMTIEHEGDAYVLLEPIDEATGVEEGEVVILRIERNGEEEVYIGVEDELLLETIFAKYLEYAEADEDADEAFEDEE